MLEAAGLYKAYGGVEALRGVDLTIRPGEVVALLGHNGAGKTTFVSIVAGLRRPDAGSVVVSGIDVARRPYDVRQYIGLAPQDLGIYPVVTVRENLVLFGELAGLTGRQLASRIDDLAEALELTELLARSAATLSGGEKRRLHTAIALLHRPPLLLLDEPTTGSDVRTRLNLLEVVRNLAADGSAVCYCTHYLAEVEALGASVAILERGRLIASGLVADLIARHGSASVEMCFEGPAPQISLDGATVVSDSVLRISAPDPTAAAATALAALGTAASRLQSIDIIHPSLESVYLELTGRRFEIEEPEVAEEAMA